MAVGASRPSTGQLPIKIGLIGAGVISGAHIAAFEKRPDRVVLRAVCDPIEHLAAGVATKAGGSAEVFRDHHSMLALPDIDGVIVATPHFLHFGLAMDCVSAGKPVLVEKPLVCSLSEIRKLQIHAAERGVSVVAGQMRRFEPEAVWLRHWINASAKNFGDLRSFDLQSWQNLEGYLHKSGAGRTHWLLDGNRAGGGVVISLAIHQLDLVRFLADADFDIVTASGRFDEPFYNGAESAASVLLHMTNGATGVLHANYLAPRVPYCEAMSLYGSHGTIIQHVAERGEYRGRFHYATSGGRPATEWDEQFEGFASVPAEAYRGVDENSFVNQLVGFAESIAAGCRPVNSIDENFNTIACVEAIHESLRSGLTVTVQKD